MPTRDHGSERVLRLAPLPDEDALDPVLARLTQTLRAEVPVRDAWRRSVLREVAHSPMPRRPLHQRMSIRPLVAAAACLASVALGLAAGRSLPRPNAMSATLTAGNVVPFAIVAPGAARVNLVGDFNGWDAHATPMRPGTDGRTWLVDVPLTPGRHVYSYVVDGDVIADPAAPRAAGDDFGVPSSVVLVGRPSA